MENQNMLFTLLSCLFFVLLLGIWTYKKTKGSNSTTEGYFLAGRGMSGGFIAGALILTNLSAEQMVGLNGQSYGTNMTNMAWEVTAVFPIVIMALLLLPRYLGGAFTTLPQFLRDRYDEGVRRLVVLLFMLGYVLVTIPSTLYSGALAVLKMFDVPALLDISYSQSIWVMVWIIGLLGAVFAIFGGMKAIAVSDTFIGIGLIIVCTFIPVIGLYQLGDGSISEGARIVSTNHTEKLNAVGSSTDSVPFLTIFTGMIWANLFYWGTNQYAIQRTLGAANLAEGQKGVLYTGFFKLLVPVFMMVPGVIAFHMYGGGLQSVDLAFPTLVANTLPWYLQGFFLVVLLGAVFSTFNALINSAATMFALDVIQPLKPTLSDRKLLDLSKWFSGVLAIASFCIAPLLMYAPDGLWELIRRFTGFFNIPIIAVVLVGIFARKVPAVAAKVVIIFHVVTYYMLIWGMNQLFDIPININYIHVYGILFFTEIVIMLAISRISPRKEAWKFTPKPKVDMKPWKYSLFTSIVLIGFVFAFYLVFSPIGLAYKQGYVSPYFWPSLGLLSIVTISIAILSVKKWNKKYGSYIEKTTSSAKTISS
ncbi:solute:sodium symporter family transporter [Priestia filamentosa]|uniref:solute:sodium symporter family transporter n=1 Tax=Priestia filamentosa TaxID=1402861 RepID=UPI0005895A9D|nr:solute:sodium symporter family transporter [Priestia filamentosa]MDT3765555.1 solute:sodium symporter family transporter [Priestia filamentosa]WCM16321.1 solute:sodium symporter family transporter [Priestia filamentosa]WRU95755.1 solute:sodium symporter family transporter [Priestia filamentosa]SMF58748.1 solute:Na+ symporter, SSS family [Priestia filamentosa]